MGWTDDAREPGVCVVRITLAIAAHEKLSMATHTFCSVSLHALGRRYQRGRPDTDDAIIADLHALTGAHERLVKLLEHMRFDVTVLRCQAGDG